MPTFSFEKRELFYEEHGKGVPIVFIHPPAMGRKVFYCQLPLQEDFRLILPDLSGQGDSKVAVQEISILGYAKEIKALFDHLGIQKAVICGYSSGGLIAQEFALTYPEKTFALILAGGFPEVKSPALRYEHLAGLYLAEKHPKILARLIASSHTSDKGFSDELYRHMMKSSRKVWMDYYERSLHYSCLERLPKLQAPLFLIYGGRDFINQHGRVYKRYTSFQTAVIKGVSHQVPTKKWKIFNQLVTGFIQRTVKTPL